MSTIQCWDVLTLGANGHSLKAYKIAVHSSTVRARTGFLGSINRVPPLSRRAAAPGATELKSGSQKVNCQLCSGALEEMEILPQCLLDRTFCKYKSVPQNKIPRVYFVPPDWDFVQWFRYQCACHHRVARALCAKSGTVQLVVTGSRVPVRIVR